MSGAARACRRLAAECHFAGTSLAHDSESACSTSALKQAHVACRLSVKLGGSSNERHSISNSRHWSRQAAVGGRVCQTRWRRPRRASFWSPKCSSQDTSDDVGDAQKPEQPFFTRPSLLLQAALGLFASGLVDAGFSGDWVRIGVFTRDTEALVQRAAYLLVPAAVAAILVIQRRK